MELKNPSPETITTLVGDNLTSEFTYTNEAGTVVTERRVSADVGNSITVGSDGAAFFTGGVGGGDISPSFFGDGSDGNVTISTEVLITRDMFYNDLTITGTGKLRTCNDLLIGVTGGGPGPSSNVYRIFVKGTLDIQAGGSISSDGLPAADQTFPPTSFGATGMTYGTAGGAFSGANGGGSSSNGLAAGAGTPGFTGLIGVNFMAGGAAGAGGLGGFGGGTAFGGAGGAGGGLVNQRRFRILNTENGWRESQVNSGNVTAVMGGAGGGGGGGAGGNSGNIGGIAGPGGAGGHELRLFANQVTLGTGSVLSARGGNGGNGRTQANPPQNVGGASGGGGGGGGFIFFVYRNQTSVAGTKWDVDGGLGGLGTGGSGLGIPGDPGVDGSPGFITAIDLLTGFITTSTSSITF